MYRPVHGQPRGWALFAHCFTCGKNLKPVVNIARALNRVGIGVFRFDFTGLGESEGDFADTNFSSNVEDLVAAGRIMAERGEAPGLLIGHSLGGAAVLHAAHDLPSVKAVATISAPADPGPVPEHMKDREEEIRTSGQATVTLAGRPFRVRPAQGLVPGGGADRDPSSEAACPGRCSRDGGRGRRRGRRQRGCPPRARPDGAGAPVDR